MYLTTGAAMATSLLRKRRNQLAKLLSNGAEVASGTCIFKPSGRIVFGITLEARQHPSSCHVWKFCLPLCLPLRATNMSFSDRISGGGSRDIDFEDSIPQLIKEPEIVSWVQQHGEGLGTWDQVYVESDVEAAIDRLTSVTLTAGVMFYLQGEVDRGLSLIQRVSTETFGNPIYAHFHHWAEDYLAAHRSGNFVALADSYGAEALRLLRSRR